MPSLPAPFTPADWYWIVNGSTTQVYSSKAGGYVPITDPTYLAWVTSTRLPSKIASELDLGGVLADYLLRPTPAGVLGGYLDALTAYFDRLDDVARAAALAIMDEENRMKADVAAMAAAVAAATSLADLKTRFATIAFTPQRTASQIKAAIRARLGT